MGLWDFNFYVKSILQFETHFNRTVLVATYSSGWGGMLGQPWGMVEINGCIGRQIKGIEENSIHVQRSSIGEKSISCLHKSDKKLIQWHIET